jgi:hypothetical protein
MSFSSFNASLVVSYATPPYFPYTTSKGEDGKYPKQVPKGDLLVEVWHTPLLHVPLILLLYWGSLLAILPLKTFGLVTCGLLLPTRCLKMSLLPIDETYL